MREQRVELVYFDGCPHADKARENLCAAGLDAWSEWNLSLDATPGRFRRYGSPTVLVDGRDVMGDNEPTTGVACRASGVPPADLIRRALG